MNEKVGWGTLSLSSRSIFLYVILILSLAGCNSVAVPGSEPANERTVATGRSPSLPPPTFSSTAAGVYRLGPLDTVNILVFQADQLSGDFQVGSDGNLSLPLIGDVPAGGKTAEEVQKEVASRLATSYMQKPQVTLKVTGFNSQKVTVDGSVNRPGSFPVASTGGTLMQYMALAGGTPRTADKSNVAVFRQVGGQRMAARFDVNAIRDGTLADPAIYGGDTIIVPESGVRAAWADFLTAMPIANFVAVTAGL